MSKYFQIKLKKYFQIKLKIFFKFCGPLRLYELYILLLWFTNYGRSEGKKPLLRQKTPKFLGNAKVYFVCHIGPFFWISLIYVFIGCP